MFSSSSRFVSLLIAAALSLPAVRADEEVAAPTNVAVEVAKVVRTTLRSYVTAYGTVDSAPAGGTGQVSGGARLAAAAAGLVVAVPVTEGTHVEKDAVLVQLDARAADAAVARAQAMVTAAEKASLRQAQLQAADGTSERAIYEAEERLAAARGELAAAKLQQAQLAIRAPIAGIVSRLGVKPGEWLEAGRDVAEVVDLNRLVILARVPSSEAAALANGQTAGVFTRLGQSEKPLAQANVEFVSPQVVAGSDQVAVRLSLPAGSGVRPGQFVAVRIVTEERLDRLAVPRESVYTDGDGQSTLSIVEGDIARQKIVQTGLRDGDWIEVSGEGVTEGATVVTAGPYALPKETKVRVLGAGKEAAK